MWNCRSENLYSPIMDQLKIRCLIVDDEPLAIEKLSGFVEKIPVLEQAGAFTNAIEAFNFLKTHQVDLLFLDIQMEDLTGIQLLEILKTKPVVIITSAYSEYALKGYELDVTDYLLKPISFERFLQAVDKVTEKLSIQKLHFKSSVTPGEQLTAQTETRFILVKTDYHMEKVSFDNMLYIEGMKDYLGIITPEKRIMTLMSFNSIEELLPEREFIRIHKSFIIAMSKIDRIERNRVIINKQYLPIGETYRKGFFNKMKCLGIIQ